MASGKQIAEQNFHTFQMWLASKTDQDFREMVSRGVLSRKEISKECGFAKSALDQNPRIKQALRTSEDSLRARGILPALEERPSSVPATPIMRETGTQRDLRLNERNKRLEEENASLRAENSELKCQLARYAVLQEALCMTARILR